MKHFRILAERFRHTFELHHQAFLCIAALVNRRTRQRLAVQKA